MLEAQIAVDGWKGGDADAAYLDKVLRHQPIELSLDESVSGALLRRFWSRAAGVAAIWFAFFFIIALLGGLGQTNEFGQSQGTGMLMVAVIGSFVIFWVVFLFSRLQEPIGEWRVLLADRAEAKDAVYSQIAGRLRDRQMPISHSMRRIKTGIGPSDVGNRIILVDGHYFAYVSVFNYGTSLYLGWMMWRDRRGVSLVGRFLSDMVAGLMGRLDPVRLMLRTERPRAMREAVHAVSREGLHVAIEQLDVPLAYGFPSGLPSVEDGVLAASAAPRSVPTAPMPSAPTQASPAAPASPVPTARQWEQEPEWAQAPAAFQEQAPLFREQVPSYQEQAQAQAAYPETQPSYQEQVPQYQQEAYQEPAYQEPAPTAPAQTPGFFSRPAEPYQQPGQSGTFGQLPYPDQGQGQNQGYAQPQHPQHQQHQQQWGQNQGWSEQ